VSRIIFCDNHIDQDSKFVKVLTAVCHALSKYVLCLKFTFLEILTDGHREE
jgi:hypothetical protein